MAYDGIMMHQVIDALNKTITGGRINKIYQISKYELLIQIRNNRTNYKLLLSCQSNVRKNSTDKFRLSYS